MKDPKSLVFAKALAGVSHVQTNTFLQTDVGLRLKKVIPVIRTRYYGCPVYLVGSALDKTYPRDVDVVIVVPDDLFLAMYGGSKARDNNETISTWIDCVNSYDTSKSSVLWSYWSRDIEKQGKELTYLCGLQVDFKTQPQTLFSSIEKPRQLV
jgi:hypothetical protein